MNLQVDPKTCPQPYRSLKGTLIVPFKGTLIPRDPKTTDPAEVEKGLGAIAHPFCALLDQATAGV